MSFGWGPWDGPPRFFSNDNEKNKKALCFLCPTRRSIAFGLLLLLIYYCQNTENRKGPLRTRKVATETYQKSYIDTVRAGWLANHNTRTPTVVSEGRLRPLHHPPTHPAHLPTTYTLTGSTTPSPSRTSCDDDAGKNSCSCSSQSASPAA